MNKFGKLIALEGLDGSGKTTVIEKIKQLLPEKHLNNTVFTREPGGTKVADTIRDIFVQHSTEEVDKLTNLFLVSASRAEVTRKVILPAMETGMNVITDRYTPSTVAYQGAGTNVPSSLISYVNMVSSMGLDDRLYVIYIRTPLNVALGRVEKEDKRDAENMWFYERVAMSYEEQYQQDRHEGKQWFVVDGTQTLDDVVEDVFNALITIIG